MVLHITVPSPPSTFANILTAAPGTISAFDRQTIEHAIGNLAKLSRSCAKGPFVESGEVLRMLACLEQIGVRGWDLACENLAARKFHQKEMEESAALVSRLQSSIDALGDVPIGEEDEAPLSRLDKLVTYLEWFTAQLENLIAEQEGRNDGDAGLQERGYHRMPSGSNNNERDTPTVDRPRIETDFVVDHSRKDEEQDSLDRQGVNETGLRGCASIRRRTFDHFLHLESDNPLLRDPLFLSLQAWIEFARNLQLQNASHAHTIDNLQEIIKDTEDDVVWQEQELSRACNHIHDLNYQIDVVKQERLDALREAERAKTEALILHDQVASFCAELNEQERYMLSLYPESEGMRGGAQAEHPPTHPPSSERTKTKSTRPPNKRSQVYKEAVTDPNLVRPVDEDFYRSLQLPPDEVGSMFRTGTSVDGPKRPQMVPLPAVEAHDPYTEYSNRRDDCVSPYVFVDVSDDSQTNSGEHGSFTRARPQTYSERYWSHDANLHDDWEDNTRPRASEAKVKAASSSNVDLFPFKRELKHQNFRGGEEELEWQHLHNDWYDDATLGSRYINAHVDAKMFVNNASEC